MKYSSWIVAAAALALALGLSPADEAKKLDDAQNLVVLCADRPVLLRVHVLVDGQSFRKPWEAYLDRLFKYLDRDDDGLLLKEEGERAPAPATLLENFRNLGFGGNVQAQVPFGDLDTNLDGLVTRDELAVYYRRSGLGPVVLAVAGGSRDALLKDANHTLFALLDADRDGQLSAAEIQAAPARLMTYDANDDEMIAPSELLRDALAQANASLADLRLGLTSLDADAGVVLVDAEPTARPWLAEALFRQYDRDADKRLSAKEVGLARPVFMKLDANGDGALDAGELGAFGGLNPEIEVTIQLGKTSGPAIAFAPTKQNLHRTAHAALFLALPDSQIDVRRELPRRPVGRFKQLRAILVQQFRSADKDHNGLLDLQEVSAPDFRFLRQYLTVADRNGDGKLAQAELVEYLDLRDAAASSCVILTSTRHEHSLFEFLDADRDDRLGPRELLTAWSRLSFWDRNREGRIHSSEIPIQYQLTWQRGQPALVFAVPTTEAVAGLARGPLWFRKMDRNADGDVSRREFLGSRADFDKIDADHDGLIDAQEAARAGQ